MPYSTNDREWLCVQDFLMFLGERRALYAPGARLKQDDAIISVQKIIGKCQVNLEQLDVHSPSALFIQKMAETCDRFLIQV